MTISYSQIDDKPINETFLDTIEFNFSDKADPEKQPSKVEGVDSLQAIAPGDGGKAQVSGVKAGNGVRYQWKGKGVLAVSPPANWQVLGFFLANDPSRSDEDWVVTYFGKTLVRIIHFCIMEHDDQSCRRAGLKTPMGSLPQQGLIFMSAIPRLLSKPRFERSSKLVKTMQMKAYVMQLR